MTLRRVFRFACIAAFYLVITAVILSPLIWDLMLNSLGSSTEFFDVKVLGAKPIPGGYAATVGDKIFITYTVVRHSLNGSCFERIWRYAENVGGPDAGEKHLLDFADLQFVGENEVRHARWPLGGLVLTNDLIPSETKSQKLAFFNAARYYCNALDYIWPRYLQGGEHPNETARVYLTLTRRE